jgi:hypothetical protein
MPQKRLLKILLKTAGAISLLLLFSILFLWPLPGGYFPASGDLADVFLPLEFFYHREIRAGRFPLWSPWVGEGYPVYASAQLGFWSIFLFPYHFLPPPTALALAYVSACSASAVAMFLLLRRWYATIPSLLGGAVFAFSGWVAAHLTHLNILFALPFLPLLIWQAEVYLSSPRPSRWLIAATVLGIAILSGQPQIVAYIILVWLFWLSWGAITHYGWHFWLKQLLPGIVIAGLLAGGLAAVQLLPLAELTQQSVRGAGLEAGRAYQYSLLPHQWITFVFPNFYDYGDRYFGPRLAVENGLYLGLIPLWLALTAGWLRRQNWPEKAWNVLALLGLLLALGWASPLRLIMLPPTLGFFTAPARWSLLTIFALSALSAAGLQLLHSHERRFYRSGAVFLLLLLLLALAGTFLLRPATWWQPVARFVVQKWVLPHPAHVLPESYYLTKFNSLLTKFSLAGTSLWHWRTLLPLLTLALALSILYFKNRLPADFFARKNLPTFFLLLAMVDLISATRGWQVWVPVEKLINPPPTVHLLHLIQQQGRLTRIFSIRPPTDSGKIFTNPHPQPAQLRSQERLLLLPARHSIWQLASTTWNAALPLSAQWKAEEELSRLRVAERGRWFTQHGITHILVSPHQAPHHVPPSFRLITTVNAEEEPPASVQIWENSFPAPRFFLSHPKAKIKLRQETPQRLSWTVSTPEPSWFFLRDSYYPGWHAWLNDKPVSLKRSREGHYAVYLPAGKHSLRLEYRPLSWKRGWRLSLLSLLLIFLLTLKLSKFSNSHA